MLIMCVDDDNLVRQVTSDMIRHLNHEVLEAADAKSALDQLDSSTNRIDVLLTDIRMPGVTGLALARSFRQRNPDIGIVYMTGYSGGEEAPGHVLNKPCTLGELQNVLEQAGRYRLN